MVRGGETGKSRGSFMGGAHGIALSAQGQLKEEDSAPALGLHKKSSGGLRRVAPRRRISLLGRRAKSHSKRSRAV